MQVIVSSASADKKENGNTVFPPAIYSAPAREWIIHLGSDKEYKIALESTNSGFILTGIHDLVKLSFKLEVEWRRTFVGYPTLYTLGLVEAADGGLGAFNTATSITSNMLMSSMP